MKVFTEWLTALCEHGFSPEDMARRLSFSGTNVEAVDDLGEGRARLHLEVTSNRADLLSQIGVARELSVLSGRPLVLPKPRFRESGLAAQDSVRLQVDEPALCPRYTARVVRRVKVRPSPEWMRRRLEGVGLRPINNVVDITNYVLYECGQPLHAFDLAKLSGPAIVVRKAWPGETITTLDGRSRALSPEMLLIADAERPVAVAGVMGGAGTEVSDATADVLLESAFFDPVSVRRTARALGLATDSSHRFAHRVDPEGVDLASRRAAQLLEELAGGEVALGVAESSSLKARQQEVALRFERLDRLYGAHLAPEEALRILEGLGFAATKRSSASVSVLVPSFRADVTREVDLIEEVARIRGFDKVPSSATRPLEPVAIPKEQRAMAELHRTLVACGYQECITLSFDEGPPEQNVSPWTDRPPIAIANPVTPEHRNLRRALLPGLLRARRLNADKGNLGVRLYEASRVYLPRAGGGLPDEPMRLAIVSGPDFRAARGVIEFLIERLRIEGRTWVEPWNGNPALPYFDERATGRVVLGEEPIGFMARTAEDGDLVLVELALDRLLALTELRPLYRPLPKVPPIVYDLSVILDESVRWAELESCVRGNAGGKLETVRLFDVYRGEQAGAGRKSLAFTLVFRDAERALSSEEADPWVQAVIGAIERDLKATVRKG